MRYWINTVSLNHVQTGAAGGFTQADHGGNTRLKRLTKGDRIIFYSPRTEFQAGQTLQRFTGIAEVLDEAPYEVDVTPEFKPWRRQVRFLSCSDAEVKPLIEELAFIGNKKSWGVAFRRGFFEIAEADYAKIAEAMRVADAA
jgi:predicted RNA-binding protein